ncbi:bifunctional glycosyltransferase family 2 protein/CDP-glycerol:glycerophosphate glycerophosphotransferase [Streptomyces sp. J2-1]|uniref:bifunctional glycosyltransferase/CDP-glycerol:glycerophosphate glycerophosphotransferase n=1 Tax=Streptomyces corallincola TaxID=2851888 RepID=UPI001C383D94|nr:bifunctional glycosyltransferase family 2 protein/CDP-glycerol:glycerophosphate glycerophosphotransferase [Streptomyces corallincola]MBV2354335.1 bifunctional glycosyltransferase family 2 protein/CDP-glycerol:glycerophosphate glycerophosphotransferase [Streptomyces corallincola]
MPRFSVIVPAYGVQAYLSECLESVLGQSFTDVEVIAVDDCSPDACGALIDEYAARDARVKPVHLARNQGLGPARNAGMAAATGEYLVFLDGDDTLTPGALAAMADRLAATGDPEVLMVDYARTHWHGATVRNRLAPLLTQDGPAPFRLTDRPALLGVLMVAWNKVCRRDFVARRGFAFPPGYYEDTPWTFPVLLAAESIATLDRVCVHYRQGRRGSILRTTSRKHFDVFEQYERVFAYVDRHPELDRWRPELAARMLDHYVTVLSRRDRLPRGSRAEFTRRARAHHRAFGVPGAAVPARSRPRHTLVRLGAHRAFGALRLAGAVRRRLRRPGRALVRALRGGLLGLYGRVQRCLPVRADRAVFAATGPGGDLAALEEAFRAHAPRLRTTWVTGPAGTRTAPRGARPARPGGAAHRTALARSKYLVSDGSWGQGLRKRRGQVLVHVPAGTPLGQVGLDLLERPAAARNTDFTALMREVDRWDHVVTGNRHSTLALQRALPGRWTPLECGGPRNDVLQRATSADVARLRTELGVPEGSVAVLYAPARRDHRRTQHPPLDLERLARRLGPRFVFLFRPPEPCDGALTADGRVLDVSAHPRPEELCLAADALLTDYAPLMFDYANLDRPVVLHTGDRDAWEASRGSYFDVRAFPPGAVARSEDEVADIFASGHWNGSRSAQVRAAFRERFCPWDDGRAAERVVRRVVLGEPAGRPAAVPLAGRNPVPSAAARARGPLATVPQPSGPLPVTESR